MQVLPKGQAAESYGDGRQPNRLGMYFHEKSGKWIEARSIPQADAFVRVGYVPATKEHLKFIEAEKLKTKEGK
jgi:hypothetical protein